MLTSTQRGAVGEQLFSACVTLTSGGELELYRPETDDDHTDVTAGRRGKVAALSIQIKTALTLDRKLLAVARMYFPDQPREHAAFLYAIVYVADAAIDKAWLVPSKDFNRLAYRGKGKRGKGIELEFMASPIRDDKWAAFRCERLELGPRLVEIVDSLPAVKPPRVPRSQLLLVKRSQPNQTSVLE